MTGIEIEIKLQLAPPRTAGLRAWLRERGARAERLRAIYFDTPDRRLAAAGIALRMRHERGQWVQALKAPAAGTLARLEDEVVVRRGRADAPPVPELSRHAERSMPEALKDMVAHGSPATGLTPIFETDIRRTTLALRSRRGWVEIALDIGRIAAPGREPVAVNEVEIELIRGSALAVVDVARRMVRSHGAWIDPASKAERGHLLAAGASGKSPARARAVRLDPTVGLEHALATMFADCRRQVLANLAAIAGDAAHDPEHIHQARVGLRRLRTAMRLAGMPHHAALDASAAALARALGEARDRDVLLGTIAPALAQAGAPYVGADAPRAATDIGAMVRATPAQLMLLDLLVAEIELSSAQRRQARDEATADAPALAAAAKAPLSATLAHWHRAIRRDARDFTALDDEARHRLRRRMKRLRYGAEFCAALWSRKRHRRFMEALALAQEALGRYNDLIVAMAHYRSETERDPRAWFAVGWLRSEADAQAGRCAEALAALRACPVPFRRKTAAATAAPP
jgi:triphosphatase